MEATREDDANGEAGKRAHERHDAVERGNENGNNHDNDYCNNANRDSEDATRQGWHASEFVVVRHDARVKSTEELDSADDGSGTVKGQKLFISL